MSEKPSEKKTKQKRNADTADDKAVSRSRRIWFGVFLPELSAPWKKENQEEEKKTEFEPVIIFITACTVHVANPLGSGTDLGI